MNREAARPYLDLIRRNRETLTVLTLGAKGAKHDATDWIVTIHFYIVCLYAKALGRCQGRNFQEHYAIKTWLNTDAQNTVIASDYRKIEEWSRDARYEGRQFDPTEFSRFKRWFVNVTGHFVKLLKEAGLDAQRFDPVDP